MPSDAQKILHEVPPGGAISAWIFVVAIVAVVLMGLFLGLRPAFPNADGETTIVDPLGGLVTAFPILLAVALFVMAGLTTSQSATTNTIVPIALSAGMPIAVVTAMWPSLVGVWLFPANGSQIAAVETDRTGTTRLSSLPIWHSFTIPMLVAWVSVVAVGLLMSLVVH